MSEDAYQNLETLVNDYLRIHEQRIKLEDNEEELRTRINERMDREGITEYTARRGTVKLQSVHHFDYDVEFLKKVLPDEVLVLITKISVNNKTLEDLVKEGKIDDRLIQPSRKIAVSRRLVVVPRKKAKLVKEDI